MPELPEVETIRRGLALRLLGARIEDVEVRDRRLRVPVRTRQLLALSGRRIEAVGRRAKYLLVHLEGDRTIIIHLGMSGRLLVQDDDAPLDTHDHVRWWLSPPGRKRRVELRYRDPRRFGLVVVVATSRLGEHALLASLGREPLVDTDAGYLAAQARGSRRSVKNFLMDARVVVGIGNIYASEILWRARVHPTVAAGRIAASRWQRVMAAIGEVLEEAIAAGGTTLSDYRDADGNLGYFGSDLEVYGREAETCSRCGGIIRRRVDAGRSTYYCTGCQH